MTQFNKAEIIIVLSFPSLLLRSLNREPVLSFIRNIQNKDERVRNFRVLMREGANVMNLEVKEKQANQKVREL